MYVQSIERAFDLLTVLSGGSFGVTELAERVELPKSTVSRLLRTLEALDAVQRSPGARYELGPAIGKLVGAAPRAAELIVRVRPHLVFLTEATGEDAGLSVPDGLLVQYVDQASAGNDVQVRDWTGEFAHMHAVPSGLVVLALLPDEHVDRYLARRLHAYTKQTMTEPAQLRDRLAEVRNRGFAVVRDEFAEGISSIAAPIVGADGEALGAIHVHGPSYRFPGDAIDTVAALLQERAGIVSLGLRG